MERERGDEIPYGEPPMRMKEHAMETMDSHELCPDGPSEDDARKWASDWLDAPPDGFDAAEFFECYIDPAGPFRYCGSFDAWDAISNYLRDDPRFLADRLVEWIKDEGPMDPRKGPNQ